MIVRVLFYALTFKENRATMQSSPRMVSSHLELPMFRNTLCQVPNTPGSSDLASTDIPNKLFIYTVAK